MMAYAVQVPYGGTKQLYTKLGPPTNNNPTSTPSWGADASSFLTAINKIVALTGLTDGQTYYVFEADATDTRAATDSLLAVVTPPFAEIAATQTTASAIRASQGLAEANLDTVLGSIATNATTAATEIGKVPRASTAIPAGGDFAWNAVSDTASKLTLNVTNEEA